MNVNIKHTIKHNHPILSGSTATATAVKAGITHLKKAPYDSYDRVSDGFNQRLNHRLDGWQQRMERLFTAQRY